MSLNNNQWKVEIQKTQSPRIQPPVEKLGFGKYFADHMFWPITPNNIGKTLA